jgi:hypothetical protein
MQDIKLVKENNMENSAVEWLKDTLYAYLNKEDKKYTDILFKKAKEIEVTQRQEDTNHGYSQGYDDAAQGKEPMKPELI